MKPGRLLLALTAVVLLHATAPPAAARPTTPAGDSLQELQRIETVTQSIRRLRPLRPVRALFPSDAAFDKLFDTSVRRDNPPNELQISDREMRVLGLLNANQSLEKIVYADLSSQVLGFYDPHAQTLYVRRHGAFGVDRYAIAHEYTHALQDQHYGLDRLMPDETKITYRDSDAPSAHHALTEGDAVLTQGLFINRTYSQADVNALNAQHVPSGPAIPPAVEREFNFPYDDVNGGVHFVQTLYAHGGMAAIDAAYRRLPSSTYEIMHPEAYLRGWRPVPVTLHGVRGVTGWTRVDDDVWGAFGYDLILWQTLGRDTADRLTDAYRGDRYIFLEHGTGSALLMDSTWADGSSTRAVAAGWKAALTKRFGHVTQSGSGTFVTPAGAVTLHQDGNHLAIAYAASAALSVLLATGRTY